jgi:plastocyanin
MRTTFASILCLAATPLALAAQHLVVVGGTGVIAYTPNNVTAAVGDTVVFEFHQKNHTVTQSTLASPCTPLANGFDSGFVPVAANATQFTRAVFTVQDTNPVWAYCQQAGHCQQGMVFAINPGTEFAAFQATATGGAAPASGSGTASAAPAGATSTTGSTGGATNHVVVVGGTGVLTYQPSSLTAAVGDTITFQFNVKNHTATQSSFSDPCRKLEFTSTTGQVGFDSGFMAVAAGTTVFPTFTVTVNDTTPIWVYCRQTGHCGQGMVFAANAPATGNTFTAFQALAMQINGTGTNTTTGSGYGSSAVRTSTFGLGAALGLVLAVAAVLL